MSWGIEPKAMVGHSVGENTAACISGTISFADCLGLVVLRGRLTGPRRSAAPPPCRSRREDLAPLLEGTDLDLAVVNSPDLSVVSGTGRPPSTTWSAALRRSRRRGPAGAGCNARPTAACSTRSWPSSGPTSRAITLSPPDHPVGVEPHRHLDHRPSRPPTPATGSTTCATRCASRTASPRWPPTRTGSCSRSARARCCRRWRG